MQVYTLLEQYDGSAPGGNVSDGAHRSTPVPPGYLKGVCWLVTFIRTAAFGRLCFRSDAAWVATSVVPFTEYQRVLELSRSSCTNDNLVATLAPFSRDPAPFAARQQSFPVQCHELVSACGIRFVRQRPLLPLGSTAWVIF